MDWLANSTDDDGDGDCNDNDTTNDYGLWEIANCPSVCLCSLEVSRSSSERFHMLPKIWMTF